MQGATLKSRAIVFAVCAGAMAFILAFLAMSHGHFSADTIGNAMIPAIVCAVMCWAATERAISSVAAAIDAAIARLARAAHGDFDGDLPPEIEANVPTLARAMKALFGQLSANLESVHRLAMFDPVTGLANRTSFRRSCERMLATMQPGDNAALLFIDLDRFKTINDTLGHAMGDMLLGMVANRLRAVAERFAAENGVKPGLIGRLAGDEFTIFFPEIAHEADAAKIGRGVLFALTEPFDLNGQEAEIGASIGIALRPEHGTTLTELMRAADAAMYHAKECGRGRAEHFSAVLAERIAGRIQLESELRRAIEDRQFALVYQPQVNLSDGRIVAAEALLRWVHPSKGVQLPAGFLRRAEETGMIVEIGEWVIETVAATVARWNDLGIEQRLAINISARQLDYADFFHRLRRAMRAARAPARLLELEITETLAMHCSADIVEAIARLRADGATIAIDDFGGGYSSIQRLRTLPVDRMKIDRALIDQVATDNGTRTIVQSMIGLIHGLGCEAVAKGIEHQAQADVLRVIGCDVIQGFAVARPMAEASFIEWVRGPRAQALAG